MADSGAAAAKSGAGEPAPTPVAIAISGASGRVGRRLLALSAADSGLRVTHALVSRGSSSDGEPVGKLAPEASSLDVRATSRGLGSGPTVLVDFSTPAACVEQATAAAELGIGLVIGTTGLTDADMGVLRKLSDKVPVLVAHNFSLGVNLLCRIAGEVATALGEGFDIEVVEAHHNRKVDAPSGTALGLARAIAGALDRDVAKDLRCGREGPSCKRTPREIGMHSLRMGSVVGDHTAHFSSDFERIELTHRAQSRDVFAAGALRAAKWLARREAGWYTMDDVLFGGRASV
ncbi:hypothetical protein FNF29_07628 [Cafeteria roenbergensis]|uniref:4-hydroxy-tetrahydrodipicolinate reductase n=1 Tax=Cafeteria roenbergensis TaxID=33653 RepID=A0A5A8C544_CAFRO|nr:hypothetical protein FNF29_07628 [Cafeteria roenbergensis]KAA0155062.1 hypothetical protein FNF31_06130 [Cafeteria roenbergensis]|eukprot:KAA0147001.1 hypothetical protein FNF29_07628 [Cafeteria roenbergensis]